jgi:hypothetical protein
MKKEDLVVLVYSQNNCYTSVLSIKKAEEEYEKWSFSVDVDKNTWSFHGKNYKISESRTCEYGARWGIIGVYNRLNDKHLDYMVGASKKATSSKGYGD